MVNSSHNQHDPGPSGGKQGAGKLDLIHCIVQRGKADRIVKKAMQAGAGGATVWFARGSGIREKLGLLGIAISPEKEVIMIITQPELTDRVFNAIVKAGRLDVPGQGLAFVTEIKQLAGIHGVFGSTEELAEQAAAHQPDEAD